MMPWINEFHYDDAGSDTGEFVEIAGPAGSDLTGYSIVLYNGANGASYATIALSGIVPSQQSGFGTITFPRPVDGIQNGAPDGIALVGPEGVVEFISYEGVMTAANGPAAGLTSTDIGVAETGTADGTSIGRTGTGNETSDFVWTLNSDDTPGDINNGQSFAAATPQVAVADISFAEGNAGTTLATFTLTRSGPADAFTVSYATADGTASAGSDYTPVAGVGSFAAGQTETTITVEVNGETFAEGDETFFLNLSGATNGATIADAQAQATIVNDDALAPSVSIGDVTQIEGDAGSTSFAFTVTRTGGTGAFSVDYVTAGGTATVSADYALASGTINFAENQTAQTITVDVVGDTLAEGDETFGVQLFNPTAGALIADGDGQGTIQNDDLTFIHDIQGSAYYSPILASEGISAFNTASTTTVTIRAVVTAVDGEGARQGFYLTEEQADWDASLNTSEGMFLMTRNDSNVGSTLASIAPGVAVGDLVTVTAHVMEYQTFQNQARTMLVNPSSVVENGSGFTLPTLTLDESHPIPSAVLTGVTPDYRDSVDDAGDTFNASNYALSYFETVEGMLVKVPDMVAADGFVSLSGGQPFLKAYSTLHADADQINDRGGYTIAGDAPLSPPDTVESQDDVTRGGRHIHDGDVNPDIFEIDFTDFAIDAPAGLVTQASMGDRLGDVTGIVDYDFTDLKLFVTAIDPAAIANTQPEREVTELGDDARSLTIATFNVENLDAADPQARFDAIADAIAGNLNRPDILTIEEIQDNNGAAAGDGITANGTDASLTWAKLVSAVNLATGENYQWVDQAPVYNAEGGEPGGNIRVGFLYNTDRVQLGDLAADATIDERRQFTDRVGDGVRDAGDRIAYSDDMLGAAIDSGDWAGTRKSLLGEFTFNGNTVYVAGNHLPSKGGSGQFWQIDQNLEAGQPANSGWDQRSELGEDIYSMLNLVQTGSPQAGLVSGGDYNDFYFYRPLEAATGYVNADGTARNDGLKLDNLTVTELTEAERYTYAFDGRSQAIDHVLVNRVLSDIADYDVVHINTGYNERGTGADASPALSDHDPALASFDYRGLAETLFGTAAGETIEGFGGDDRITGRGGDDVIDGGAGADTALFAGNRDDYRITLVAGDVVVEDLRAGANDGADQVRAVEKLSFADATFNNLANGVPEAQDDLTTVAEDATSANLYDLVLVNDSDEDLFDDSLSIQSVDSTGTRGTVIFDAASRELRYVADNDAFDALAPGETTSDSFTYTVSDGQGGIDTATLELTITGTADRGKNIYVFERITPDEAVEFDADDELIFLDTGASALSVQFRAASGLTNASLTLSAGSIRATFPAVELADASQAGLLTFVDGSNLVFADQTGGALNYVSSTTQNTTFYGFDASNEIIATGTGDAIIHGGGGNDYLEGVDGNDYIFGGTSTTANGGNGIDTIEGGAGNDHLYGGDFTTGVTSSDGADLISGGSGDDHVQGNAGKDTLTGGDGQDRILGGSGDDEIDGERGFDSINGNMGNDTISGGVGNDSIRGGQGSDLIQGDEGQDILLGDLGNDTLTGGTGIDVVTGGDGADVFVFGNGDTVSGPNVTAIDAEGNTVVGASGAAVKLTGQYDSVADFAHGVDKIDLANVTSAVAGGAAATAAAVIYAQAGATFTSVSAAQTYAQQLLDNTTDRANTFEVASIQVAGATYLFSHETAGAAATIDSIIRLDGTNAKSMTASDFV
jgi:predicted extracellular nuclease/Ca2+-binding RTX toxin-like protein